MPWCPKFRRFQEEDDLCIIREPDPETFLLTVANENEANLIEALLTSNEIPVLRKYRESGGYLQVYMGTTSFGIDLFVPFSKLETAKELVNVPVETLATMEAAPNPTEIDEGLSFGVDSYGEVETKTYSEQRRYIARLLLIILVVPEIIGLVVVLWFYVFD